MRILIGSGFLSVLGLSLLTFPQAVAAARAQKPVVLTAARGSAATFDPANCHQPANISFSVVGQVLSVGVASVEFFPPGTIARYEIRQMPPTRIAVVTAVGHDGRQSVLQTALTDGKPSVTLYAVGPGTNGGNLVLFLANVDNVLHTGDGGWTPALTAPGQKLSVPAASVVFHSRSRSQGLILRVADAPGLRVKLVGGRTGIWVYIPAAGPDQARRVTVSGFLGEAVLALDEASSGLPAVAARPASPPAPVAVAVRPAPVRPAPVAPPTVAAGTYAPPSAAGPSSRYAATPPPPAPAPAPVPAPAKRGFWASVHLAITSCCITWPPPCGPAPAWLSTASR